MRALAAIMLGLLLIGGPAKAQAEAWLEQLDIPLAAGLTEDETAGTVFETATGRVVVVEARGAVAATAVQRYYGRVLPELGWRASGANRFLRDGEALTLAVARADDLTLVIFRLSPEG